MPSPEREAALQEFSRILAQAVADALHNQPPVVQLPEPIVQALFQLVNRPPQVVAAPMPGLPAVPWQQQALGAPKAHVVLRMNDFGQLIPVEATVPQLLAEIADILKDHTHLLMELNDHKSRRGRKVG